MINNQTPFYLSDEDKIIKELKGECIHKEVNCYFLIKLTIYRCVQCGRLKSVKVEDDNNNR